ncbi:claudin domain-containing protein 2-like [Amphiura filiformis]|uniref:claudin domain-containing protein 2-like n=1 Tax=Amphiura filiformis TaxID=82378 RepID=UPI003B21C2D5
MEGRWFLAPNTALIGTGVSVFSVSTRYWTRTRIGYAGLWKGCIAVGSEWRCADTHWPNADPWIPAVKGLALLSIVLTVVAMAFAAMAYFKESYVWTRWATAIIILQEITLACGLFTFLGYIINNGNRQDLSWSYFFGWVSVGFYAVAAIFFSIQAKKLRMRSVYQNIN